MEAGDFRTAIQTYGQSFDLLPDPKDQWQAATWLMGAIGDAGFQGAFFVTAREALEFGMACPDGLGNPFMHLRLGQVLFENGELDGAADNLMRAYMGAGVDIFVDEDPKYLEFLGSRAPL